jgi:signal recognition particle subunit SRP54
MAGRILGMGDIVGFVEKAQEVQAQEDADKLAEKIKRATFDLEDFRKQIRSMRRMGPLREVLSYLPFFPGGALDEMEIDDKEIDHIEAMINSMTPHERRMPELIGASRRNRIACGAGMDGADVSKLIKQFMQVRKVMRKVSSGNLDALQDALPPELTGGRLPVGVPAASSEKRRKAREERKRKKRRRRKR